MENLLYPEEVEKAIGFKGNENKQFKLRESSQSALTASGVNSLRTVDFCAGAAATPANSTSPN